MARPGWSSTRPSTVARWYSTDSAPIMRIQPTGSPRLNKPGPISWQATGLQSCSLRLVVYQGEKAL
jgi:hypothetical protein